MADGAVVTAALDPRFARVILAANAATRDTHDESWPDRYDELCAACEQITDDELEALRGT